MRIRIEGTNLPGLRCGQYTNVYVALQCGQEPWEPAPGDSDSVTWAFEVRLRKGTDGGFDFGGPFVHGPRGSRFVYITWGEVRADGAFVMFRRAKLPLGTIPPELVAAAEGGAGVVGRLPLTDGKGMASTATVRPPSIEWKAAAG